MGFTALSPRPALFPGRRDGRTARRSGTAPVSNSRIEKLVQSLAVLVVDDNQYMRKVVRNILVNLGVKNVHEAADGIAGLEAIRMSAPDLVVLDWKSPLLTGPELCGLVPSRAEFQFPKSPSSLLTG